MNVETRPRGRHVLITGVPGVGKTTLIVSLVGRLSGSKAGFYTREVRAGTTRSGFVIGTIDGRTAPLAETGPGSPRVGKYHVLTESLERVAVPAISGYADYIIIDEIGKMETMSDHFKRAVVRALDGRGTVIATIARRGDEFIEGLKRRQDARLFEVTRQNRDSLVEAIVEVLADAGGAR